MKETPEKHPEFDPETYTDSILEECYRIKAEISAQFKNPGELYAYLKAIQEEEKRNGNKICRVRSIQTHPFRKN